MKSLKPLNWKFVLNTSRLDAGGAIIIALNKKLL